MGERVRRRVRVRGRVQGVFFRDSTRHRAQSAGLGGWVANRPDGSVEAVFEGRPDAVAAMVDYCRRGPRGAQVSDVEVDDEPVQGLDAFSIR